MLKVLVCVADAQFFLLLRHVLASEGFDSALVTQPVEIEEQAGEGIIAAIVTEEPGRALDLSVSVRLLIPHAKLILLDRRSGPRISMPDCDLVLQRPFDPSRLLLFLRQLRSDRLVEHAPESPGNLLTFADIQMNLATVKVMRAGRAIPLTALQFRLLRRLLQEPARVRDRDDLISACWPAHIEVEPRTVDIHIGHVRRALARFGPDLIRTARGQGYAMKLPSKDDGS